MTINPKTIFTFSLFALLSLGSCDLFQSEEEKAPYYVVKTDESKDINKLGKLINLEKFRPEKVQFQHTYIETVNGNGSAEEPKDDYLQAVLYFDSITFERMLNVTRLADYSFRNYSKKTFDFPWLSDELSDELENSDSLYHGHPDLFFESEGGKLWLMNKKVLFYREIR